MTMSNKPCVPTNSCFLAIFTEITQFVVEILRAITEIYPFLTEILVLFQKFETKIQIFNSENESIW